MQGQRIGYIRVSTSEQNTERQLEGIQLDRIFIDQASGKDIKRPQLEALLRFIRERDIVFVHSMDRLARNLDHLRQIVHNLTSRKVHIQFHKESLLFTGEDSPLSNLLLNMLGAIAEFERSLIKERQKEGILLAKKKGLYKGRKPNLSAHQQLELKSRIELGIPKAKVAKEFKISRETVYKYLKNLSQTDPAKDVTSKNTLI